MSDYVGKALVCGAGGFIGSHMVRKLKEEGYWVRGVDKKAPEFAETEADEFIYCDLTEASWVDRVVQFKGWNGNFYNQIPSLKNLSFHVVSQKFVVYGVIFSTLWQLVELSKQKYIDLID